MSRTAGDRLTDETVQFPRVVPAQRTPAAEPARRTPAPDRVPGPAAHTAGTTPAAPPAGFGAAEPPVGRQSAWFGTPHPAAPVHPAPGPAAVRSASVPPPPGTSTPVRPARVTPAPVASAPAAPARIPPAPAAPAQFPPPPAVSTRIPSAPVPSVRVPPGAGGRATAAPVAPEQGRHEPAVGAAVPAPPAAAKATATADAAPTTAGRRRASRRARAASGPPAPVLPRPPSDEEKGLYRRRRLPVLMVSSFVSFGGLLVSQVLFIRMSPWLLLLVPLFAFTVLYYLISTVVNIRTPGFDLERHRRLVRDFQPDAHPSVDVFLPVCGEATEVLRNTWEHVSRMAAHYRGRVHVYVLDDSATDEREAMALGFGFVYQRRPNRGWYKKAGNMRYAYQRTLGDYILVLDADFTPRHDMLDEMVPYFSAEPDLGIVQSPQFFRVHAGQGWLERGAGAVQELFYRMVQVSRQHHEAAICVGSCALYRREALDAIGGSTLIEHSEDVHTGFDMRRRGWRLRYLPIPLATGLCPADVNSFFTQQYRWCAGSMSLLGSTKFWNTRMRLRTRLSYVSGFCYYLHTALFTFVGPLVPIIMLVWFPQYVEPANYLLILPSIVYNLVVFPAWHTCSYGIESWTVKMIYGWAHAFAVWDLLRGQSMGWQPTGGTTRKNRTGRLWVGMALFTGGSGALWTLLAAHRMATTDLLAFAPAFLGGVFYLTVALQALLVDPVKDIRRRRSR